MVWGFLSSLTGHSASNSKVLYVFCEVVLDSALGVLFSFVLKTDQGHSPCGIDHLSFPDLLFDEDPNTGGLLQWFVWLAKSELFQEG